LTTATKRDIRFSKRVRAISESPTLSVLARATALVAQGVDIVDFGPGEPDFATPKNVADAGRRAIEQGFTKYTHSNGMKSLREALADRYNRRYSLELTTDNVISGTGGKPVFARCEASNRYRPTFAAVESVATEKTRGVIINSPCNPTGAVIEEKELRRIVEWCAARDAFVLFDETYELFVYDGNKHVSAMTWYDEYPETIIAVNSMSKTYAMTGWRLGYAVGNAEIIAAAGRIQSHATSNPSTITQAAALEALTGDQSSVRKMHDAYAARRAYLVPALNSIDGFCCADPDGAFYVFPEVNQFFGRGGISDSNSFATFLIEHARVAVVPGIGFGADECVRISYATSMDRLKEGVARIAAAVKKL